MREDMPSPAAAERARTAARARPGAGLGAKPGLNLAEGGCIARRLHGARRARGAGARRCALGTFSSLVTSRSSFCLSYPRQYPRYQ